jgi:hypothetical protein
MSLRRRTFPELLDSMLTSIVGGAAAEEHAFPPPGADGPPYEHRLQAPPAADVVSLHGSRNGATHLFVKDADYALSDDGTTVAWKPKGELPDPGTLVLVNYTSRAARAALDDLFAGSVVRTLAESAALELARLYAQLETVYDAGFVDTATGTSLDNVVALLGVERVRSGRASGEIEFTRVSGSRGEVAILAGTRVMTADGKVEYATTATVTLADHQSTVRIPARDLAERSDPLPAGTLTVLPVPIQGIVAVTNPAPTTRGANDETDVELRARAKGFLHGSERATLGALRNAITRQQIDADVHEHDTPGVIDITPHAEQLDPELQQRLLAAIEESRPAGVLVRLRANEAPQKLDLELLLQTGGALVEQDLRAAHAEARRRIEDYFARLPAKELGSLNRLVGLLLGVPGIEDVRFVRASTAGDPDVLDRDAGVLKIGGMRTVLGALHVADPNLPTELDVTIAVPNGGPPPDVAAAAVALRALLARTSARNASETASETLDYAGLLVPALTAFAAEFLFTVPAGVAEALRSPADGPYVLTPFERVTLRDIHLQEVPGV